MNPVLRAALWMSGSIASFSLMAVAGREVSSSLDTFEIMMYRSVVGVIIVCILAAATGAWRGIKTDRLGVHLIRNAAHFTGQNLWFYAVTVIPLAQVFALEFTSPIWVIVLSPFILGERLTPVRALAALMGFAGILIVARPDMQSLNPGLITAASSAIFFAITIMLTKRLTRNESITSILFWLTLMQLVMGVALAGWDGNITWPDAQTGPWVFLIGGAGLLAHYCLTNALAIAPATVVVPIDFIRLPTIAVIGMFAYGEAIDIWVFIGAMVIFAGNYINIWVETKRPKTL
ncbi:MAG: DMT family transporter [Tateyamaria sp.]|uniref:DMT family transporter n=1 Tax=Tateyamaria sp. TaxID=1929288 RepID=UPI00329D53E9